MELVTAPLEDKIILDGVTRRSVLELARERLTHDSKHLPNGLEGLEVVERKYTMLEVLDASREGRLIESFVAGTAVSPSNPMLNVLPDISVFYHACLCSELPGRRCRDPNDGRWKQR